MDTLHGYHILREFSTENAGLSRWSFGEKEGRQFFIKEFLTPVYPDNLAELSPETVDGLLRLDLLEQGSSHSWPSFLKWSQESMKNRIAEFWRTGRAAEYIADYRFTNWHDIRHKYHVEYFEKDPFHPNDTAKEGVCILFDYSKDSLEWHEITL